MKNNRSVKNKPNMSLFKKSYYITLENAGKKTQGGFGQKVENQNPARYSGDKEPE